MFSKLDYTIFFCLVAHFTLSVDYSRKVQHSAAKLFMQTWNTSPMLKQKTANPFLLHSKAMEFSPFWHTSHLVLPCFQNCTENSLLPQEVIQIVSPSLPPCYNPRPHVRACVCVCEHYNDYILSLRFHVYIFVYFVKCNVLTLVYEIQCYRNDHYYYFYYWRKLFFFTICIYIYLLCGNF